MSQQSTIDIHDDNNSFPFHTLTNSEFETLGSTNRLTQSDLDRLSQLRFNPFQTNQNIALSGNNIELDTWFNTNSICCDYFLPIRILECKMKLKILQKNVRYYI